MSLHPCSLQPVPAQTAAIARAAFPKGNFYLRLREELGTLFTNDDFACLYPARGRPALAPWMLALVTIFQFLENLTDRQAADAVRSRIDWKYALGLDLSDSGFDFSVLSEFRTRLIAGAMEQVLLDKLLSHFKDCGLLKARGRQRTDSTHILASIRVMNRLELVMETMRATLNELSLVSPSWLSSWAPVSWQERYGPRADNMRLPKGETGRQELAQSVGEDGFMLLERLSLPDVGSYFGGMVQVSTLRQVWERHYERDSAGKVRWRAGPELLRAGTALESPYDIQARHCTKRDTVWTGYRVHLTEVCEPDALAVITHVHTGVATQQDISCTQIIHAALSAKSLLPSRHIVDTGYIDADLLVESRDKYQVELFGPPRLNPSWQTRESGLDRSAFQIDWQRKQAICPEGKISSQWQDGKKRLSVQNGVSYEYATTHITFADKDCKVCPSRSVCTHSIQRGRRITLGSQAEEEALQTLRNVMSSEEGKIEYRKRAAVEGTLSQALRRCALRKSRYRGLEKTHLQHLASATALNLDRFYHHITGRRRAHTRISRFAALVIHPTTQPA